MTKPDVSKCVTCEHVSKHFFPFLDIQCISIQRSSFLQFDINIQHSINIPYTLFTNMKYISFANILIQIQLFALSGDRVTYAFQLTREKAIRSYSTELFLSYQSIAASLPKETNKEVQLLDRPRLQKTIPSGQNQLPLHIRIAKVRCASIHLSVDSCIIMRRFQLLTSQNFALIS